MSRQEPIRIAHLLFQFNIGGLENGIVNLINGLPSGKYTHHIITLQGYDELFASRINAGKVELHDLDKRDGQDPAVWLRLNSILARIKPDVFHSRNLGALEGQVPALLRRVPRRLHGEHGWDIHDIAGTRKRYQIMRRALGLGVHRFITVSKELETYLVNKVGLPARKVQQIYNGVDLERFSAAAPQRNAHFVFGTVGRFKAVKNQMMLIRAFATLLESEPQLRTSVRLRVIGDGPLLESYQEQAAQSGMADLVEFPGAAEDVPAAMKKIDVFVLPSLNEGISNTILEAMASGVPVIATRVGGNPELVVESETGRLVSVDEPDQMVKAMLAYVNNRALANEHGEAGRLRVQQTFSLDKMLGAYDELYSA